VLFFNYNWDMLGKTARIAVSSVPLAIGAVLGMVTLSTGRGVLWREASALFSATGTALLIAMLSQIYQTGGSLYDFMTLTLLLALPFLYIFNSILLATIYVFAMFVMTGGAITSPAAGTLVLAGWAIFAAWHLGAKASPYAAWVRYLTLPAAVFAAIILCEWRTGVQLMTLAAIMAAAGAVAAAHGVPAKQNPWLPVGAFALGVLLLVGGCRNGFFSADDHASRQAIIWSQSAFWVAQLVYWLLAAELVRIERRNLAPVWYVIGLMVLCNYYLVLGDDPETVGRIGSNVIAAVAGLLLVINGVRRNSSSVFNAGLALLAGLVVCRFFDSDLGVLWRSAGFVASGLLLLAGNLVFIRRRNHCSEVKNV